jgi:Sec-independent protein translocase protein TatA
MIQRQQQRNAAARAVLGRVVLEKGIIAKVVLNLGSKRKPTQRPSVQRAMRGFREFLSSISSLYQRSLSGNSSTSAAARVSQQKQQAQPADWRDENCMA